MDAGSIPARSTEMSGVDAWHFYLPKFLKNRLRRFKLALQSDKIVLTINVIGNCIFKESDDMKNKLSVTLFIIVLCFFGWFGYSYIGIDKETQVPKALLMKIRPLPWKEIYWDEEDQLLKTAIAETTATGDESRCLRIYRLTPSGLLMGGYEFLTRDSIGITNAFVNFEINGNEITMFDQRSSETLFTLDIPENT